MAGEPSADEPPSRKSSVRSVAAVISQNASNIRTTMSLTAGGSSPSSPTVARRSGGGRANDYAVEDGAELAETSSPQTSNSQDVSVAMMLG